MPLPLRRWFQFQLRFLVRGMTSRNRSTLQAHITQNRWCAMRHPRQIHPTVEAVQIEKLRELHDKELPPPREIEPWATEQEIR